MREKIYDGKILFQKWAEWGAAATNTRLQEFAKAKFGSSSNMGPYYAMWAWAFRNPEDAWPLWKKFYLHSHPDKEQPTFEDFLKILQTKGGSYLNVSGSKRKLQQFCSKYNLEMDYKIKKEDVIQITKRDSPLFQALMIVDKVEGMKVTAFLVNSDSTRVEYTFDVRHVGVIDKALFGRRQGVFTVAEMTKLPKLRNMAESAGTPLITIDFDQYQGVRPGVRFVYEANPPVVEFYDDIETGIEREIERFKVLLSEAVSV